MPCRDITVIKIDGSEFKVEVEGVHLRRGVTVGDLKRIIAVDENISFDKFDSSFGDVVLKSPEQLKLSLRDAGIVDTVSMTMKKGEDYRYDSDECTVCRMPYNCWQDLLCRRCYWQQMVTSQQPFPREADPQFFVTDDESQDEDDCELV